jgi:hypothetical protein
MDWEEILGKIKLMDVDIKPQADQVGIFNVKVYNTTVNLTFEDIQAVENFRKAPKTEDLERRVKEVVENILKGLGPVLDALPTTVSSQVVTAATVVSGVLATSTTTTEPHQG